MGTTFVVLVFVLPFVVFGLANYTHTYLSEDFYHCRPSNQ